MVPHGEIPQNVHVLLLTGRLFCWEPKQQPESILEHTPEIAEEHPAGEEYNLKNALRGITIPVHSGATRYYSEKKITHKHFVGNTEAQLQSPDSKSILTG